jgi:hypothetical protein
MKKVKILFFFALGMVFFISGVQKSAGPPGCYAGEPPNNTNCTSCHSSYAVNTGSASIGLDLGGAEVGYIPGQTYEITVSVQKSGMRAAGFQLIALRDNDYSTSPGRMVLTQPTRTQRVDSSNRHLHSCGLQRKVWVEHTYQGITSDSAGRSTWNFQWVAPDSLVGNVTFYLAALETNFDGRDDGDYTYTRQVSAPALSTQVLEVEAQSASVKVYPNPVGQRLYLQTFGKTLSRVDILNLQGQRLKRFEGQVLQGNGGVDVEGLSAGTYYVLIKGEGVDQVQKIVVQR